MLKLFISSITLILLSNFIEFPAHAEPVASDGSKAIQSRQNATQPGKLLPNNPPYPRVEVGGTGSGNFYNYWDSETQSDVWGVRAPRQPDSLPEQQAPVPPIFVTPEIKWPYPQEHKPVPSVSIPPQNPPLPQ